MRLLLRILVPLVIVGGSFGIAVYLMKNKPEPDQRTPPPSVNHVDAVRLQRQEYQVVLPSHGTVQPRTQSTLKPQIGGKVLSISPSFRDGGFFEKEELLLEIEPIDYETAVVAAEAILAQATSNLELETAQHEQAIENWKKLGDGSEPSPLTLREPQMAEAKAAVASAGARLKEAKRNLERTRITAPYAGRIRKKEVDVGQYVTPGSVLAEVFAVDYVEIRLPLRNEHLDFIRLPEAYRGDQLTGQDQDGPRVVLHGQLGSRDETWEGRIVRAEGAYDASTRELFVVAQVDDPYARKGNGQPPLKVGQFVEAEIHGSLLHDVFVLPRSAIRDGQDVLMVDAQSTLRRRKLPILWKDDSEVVVRNNLREGDLLCITPLLFAVEGVKVAPRIEGEPRPKPGKALSGRPEETQGKNRS